MLSKTDRPRKPLRESLRTVTRLYPGAEGTMNKYWREVAGDVAELPFASDTPYWWVELPCCCTHPAVADADAGVEDDRDEVVADARAVLPAGCS